MTPHIGNLYGLMHYFGVLLFVFLLGCFATLAAVGYLIIKYLDFSSIAYKKTQFKVKSVCFSDVLKENMNFSSLKSTSVVESCRFLNVLLAFLIKEWRDTATVHKWVVKKIKVEIDELLETKAAKRLLNSIRINDIDLGANSPVIHGISIKEPCSFTNSTPPDLVMIDIELEYDGGFQLAVDVDLLFGASAFVSINVKHLKGQVRVQMNRKPCTHWSVSFVEEPVIDIQIDTNFLSRPLPQLGSLILNQVYRTIRRKHTFPNYKVRYTPFNAFWFDHCDVTDEDDMSIPPGKIDVTIVACSRLLLPQNIDKRKVAGTTGVVFATLSLSSLPSAGVQSAPTETKKNNFLLTTIADALSEVDLSGKYLGSNERKPGEVREESDNAAAAEEMHEESVPPAFLVTPPEIVRPPDSPKVDPLVTLKEDPPPFKTNKSVDDEEANASLEEEKLSTRTSYMMVTRNFSAVLNEENAGIAELPSRVFVGPVVWSKSSNMKQTISEGDRILSINGHAINSLSQAIAVINQIRAEKRRFFFKVHRKRSRGASMRSERSQESHSSFSRQPPRPPSDSDEQSLPDDTESDFTDLDTDEHESYANESTTSSIPLIEDIKAEAMTGPPSSPAHQVDANPDPDQLATASSGGKTSLCNANQSEYSWPNETFSLDIDETHKYLNVRLWYQEVSSASPSKKDSLTQVGALAVPLQCIQQLCALMTSSTMTRRYKVTSPFCANTELRRTAERFFKQKTGFKLDHCYGDITLTTNLLS